MSYIANLNIKINTNAVIEFKAVAKAKEEKDFDEIQLEIKKKFSLNEAEVNKVRRKAEFELAMECCKRGNK